MSARHRASHVEQFVELFLEVFFCCCLVAKLCPTLCDPRACLKNSPQLPPAAWRSPLHSDSVSLCNLQVKAGPPNLDIKAFLKKKR